MDATDTGKSLSLICPNLKCRKVLRVPEQCRGSHVKCHYCGLTFQVPQDKPHPAGSRDEE